MLNIYNAEIYDENEIKKIHEKYPSLDGFDILNFNTSKVTDMSYLFDSCQYLQKMFIINFDTSKVKNMNRIFCGCKSLTDIDLSKFKAKKDVTVHAAFKECHPQLVNKVKSEVLYINIKGRNAF